MFLGLCNCFPLESSLSLPFPSLFLESLPLPLPLRSLPLLLDSLPFGRACDAPGLPRERDLSLTWILGLDRLLPLSRDGRSDPSRDFDLFVLLSSFVAGSPSSLSGVLTDLLSSKDDERDLLLFRSSWRKPSTLSPPVSVAQSHSRGISFRVLFRAVPVDVPRWRLESSESR